MTFIGSIFVLAPCSNLVIRTHYHIALHCQCFSGITLHFIVNALFSVIALHCQCFSGTCNVNNSTGADVQYSLISFLPNNGAELKSSKVSSVSFVQDRCTSHQALITLYPPYVLCIEFVFLLQKNSTKNSFNFH